MTRWVTLAALLLFGLLAWSSTAQEQGPSPGDTPDPGDDTYQLHLDNGVKLYKEGKYDGAVAEFWAAYRQRKLGSPLINLALAYKAMKNPAKAIEVLELALGKHRDTMPEGQQQAAEREVREMKALLAWVKVDIEPDGDDVKLYVDERLLDKHAWDKPLPLEPGTRRFRATRPGYVQATAELQIVAGTENELVRLKLVQKEGRVRVVAHDKESAILIDGQIEGKGTYNGMLGRGVHRVGINADGTETEIAILVRPGGNHVVKQAADGSLQSKAMVKSGDDDDDSDFGPPKALEVFRGIYFYGSGSLLTVFSGGGGEQFDQSDSDRFGAAAGLHIGYRVAQWAGFEFWGQYSDVRIGAQEGAQRMTLKSGRAGLLFRAWFPGKSWVRFTATLGSGLLFEKLSWKEHPEPKFDNTDVVVGFFGGIDLGLEFEYSNVLIALMFQHTIQGTKQFDIDEGINAFDETPLFVHGPSLRVGYGLW